MSRLHFQGLAFSYFLGVGCEPPGAGCRCELRRASRAGAENSIRDAGALRAPVPATDFFDLCIDVFFSFGFRCFLIFLQFLSISGANISYLVFSYRVSGAYQLASTSRQLMHAEETIRRFQSAWLLGGWDVRMIPPTSSQG